MSYVKKEEVSKSPIKRTECRVLFLTAAKIRARARSLTSPVMRAAKRCSSVASSFLSSIITYLP